MRRRGRLGFGGVFGGIGRADEGSTVSVKPGWSVEPDRAWVDVEIASGRMLFTREERASMLEPHAARVLQDDSLRLSIDRRIVDEHGGSMVMSASEGQGSSISLRFPAFRPM